MKKDNNFSDSALEVQELMTQKQPQSTQYLRRNQEDREQGSHEEKHEKKENQVPSEHSRVNDEALHQEVMEEQPKQIQNKMSENLMMSNESIDRLVCEDCKRVFVYTIDYKSSLCPLCMINLNCFGIVDEQNGELSTIMIENVAEVTKKETVEPEKYKKLSRLADIGKISHQRLLFLFKNNHYEGRPEQMWTQVGKQYVFSFEGGRVLKNRQISFDKKMYVAKVLKDLGIQTTQQLSIPILQWISNYFKSDLRPKRLKQLVDMAEELYMESFQGEELDSGKQEE